MYISFIKKYANIIPSNTYVTHCTCLRVRMLYYHAKISRTRGRVMDNNGERRMFRLAAEVYLFLCSTDWDENIQLEYTNISFRSLTTANRWNRSIRLRVSLRSFFSFHLRSFGPRFVPVFFPPPPPFFFFSSPENNFTRPQLCLHTWIIRILLYPVQR